MGSLEMRGEVDQTNEIWMRDHYDQLMAEHPSEYCLVTLALKRFSGYAHRLGKDESERAIQQCFALICSCMREGEYAARLHSHYFNLLLCCPPCVDDLHKRAHAFHFVIRDTMEALYGKRLFLEMGFYPMIKEGVDFYSAQYFADLCRINTHHEFPETNYDFYYLCFNDQQEKFTQIEQLVQPALSNGDFKLFLQPKVDLRTGKVTSAEALVRWIDPERGMIPLSSFLPNLDENGFIREVDLYLFGQACNYLEKWIHTYGKEFSISFNLSRAYFNGPYFMPEYTAVFEQHHIPPRCIQIELLETIVLNDMDQLKPLVQAIYDYGFSCALDDFGSGFSSFEILNNVQLSVLKIDRALFRDVNNHNERLLIKHIIDLAHELKILTVAEGIETAEYAQYLKELGCDFIQGFYYFKPMPVEEFEQRFVLGSAQAQL